MRRDHTFKKYNKRSRQHTPALTQNLSVALFCFLPRRTLLS